MEKYGLMLSFDAYHYFRVSFKYMLLWSNLNNICKNMIFTCALGARVIRIKSTKTEHKPIYYHSKPGTNMADYKAIKAHASCDHERALYGRF